MNDPGTSITGGRCSRHIRNQYSPQMANVEEEEGVSVGV